MALTDRQNIAVTLRVAAVPATFEHKPADGRPDDPLTAVEFTVTAATDLITSADHGLTVGERVRFVNSGGALPAGLAAATDYYVIASGLTANDFKVSATDGGSAVDITGAGTGTHTWTVHLSTDEQAEFDAYYDFVIAGKGSLPAVPALARAVALMGRFSAYHQSPAYKTWWHDNEETREAQYRLRKAEVLFGSTDTVPISADDTGAGSDPPTSPISHGDPP